VFNYDYLLGLGVGGVIGLVTVVVAGLPHPHPLVVSMFFEF
jgi:hypothetical protein